MSERSVAEIIGWVIEDNPWYNERTAYREEPKRLRANGEYWLTSKRPTVDDLLAWLRGQGYDVITKVMRFASDEPIVWAEAANRKVVKKAPTLLAALEAAVRAVAGEA